MAFTKDLAQFFDTQHGFAEEATFNDTEGELIRTAAVIFTDALDSVGIFDNQVEADLPFLHCQTSDVADLDSSVTVTIRGTTYRIVGDHKRTGIGTSIVRLAK